MIFFNQRNYPDIIYSKNPPHTETIASSGCGICAMAMVIANVAGGSPNIKALADEAVKKGWRIDGAGTDLIAMAPAIAKQYDMKYSRTSSIDDALETVKNGGMVIANVTALGSNGIFSTGGHFVCIAGIASDGRIMVLDPNLYSGKFNTAPRKGKVEVRGNECYVSKTNLMADVRKDYAAYYKFSKEKERKPMFKDVKEDDYAYKHIRKLLDYGIVNGDENYNYNPDGSVTRRDVAIMIANALTICGK